MHKQDRAIIKLRVAEIAKKAITLKDAIKLLAAKSISLTKKEGEYRVNVKGGKEATAYYTNDLDDAIGTALHQWDKK